MTIRIPTRIEKDSLGTKPVPAYAYWGIATQRAIENFPISELHAHPRFVDSYVLLKKACAVANAELKLLKKDISQAIQKAADEILTGRLRDQFVVDVYQMGAGTSFHMNVNEVLANRAIEFLKGKKGSYKICHPNDHVNYGQSTNDTFPSAMRISARLLIQDLLPVLKNFEKSLEAKGREFDKIIKSGRTHLQDAVPIRLGQEFSAYAVAVRKCRELIERAAISVEELGIGGTATGTGLNTHPKYRYLVVQNLNRWTKIPFRVSEDMREAMQSNRPISEVASTLRILALELTRIANDLRLLTSGPLTGFAEIILPAVQPGSSIMPGKVNPSMAEMLNQVCFQVIGNAHVVDLAVQAGQLELNVMMPVMAHNINSSLEILRTAIRQFDDRCVKGITANVKKCRYYAETSPSLATALNPIIGYAKAAEVFKEAIAKGKSISTLVIEKGYLSEKEAKKVLDPMKMTGSHRK